MIAAGLRHLRRGGQLIQKQDALPGSGKKLRRHPFGLVFFDPGQSPQIDRIELHGADIEELIVEIARYLCDDL